MTLRAELSRCLVHVDTKNFPPGWIERVESLDHLLQRWAGRMSLSGLSGEGERAQRYFAEAFAAARFVPRTGNGLDIGSGAGSPALPLAVVTPEVSWILVESRGRRAGFLREAVRLLGLKNVLVETRRFDASWRGDGYDVVTTRGVKLGGGMLQTLGGQLTPGGRHLWFSSESILREGVSRLRERPRLRLEGPIRLLPGSNQTGGWLLVCERSSATGCFT